MAKDLKDPVDKDASRRDDAELEAELAKLDPDLLSDDELGGMPSGVVRPSHPFSGYPIGRKIKVAVYGHPEKSAMVSTTFLVLLKDPTGVFQDPSGHGVSHTFFKQDGKGNDITTTTPDGRIVGKVVENQKIINLKTFHSRVGADYDESNGEHNIESVFDRVVTTSKGRKMLCAVVPNHSVRAQIVLKLVKGKVTVDQRYLLADKQQDKRLTRVFRNAHYQQLQGERAAQRFDAEPELTAAD